MIRPERQLDIPDCPLSGRDEVYIVRRWRAGLDELATAFQLWYVDHVFRPFLRFSKNYVGVPGIASLTSHPDGSVTHQFYEDEGAYAERENALNKCEDDLWAVIDLPLNTGLPAQSCEYNCGAEYPKGIGIARSVKQFPVAVRAGRLDAGERQLQSMLEQTTRMLQKDRVRARSA